MPISAKWEPGDLCRIAHCTLLYPWKSLFLTSVLTRKPYVYNVTPLLNPHVEINFNYFKTVQEMSSSQMVAIPSHKS